MRGWPWAGESHLGLHHTKRGTSEKESRCELRSSTSGTGDEMKSQEDKTGIAGYVRRIEDRFVERCV